MSEYPWLATVIHDDGTQQRQRCTSREQAETWRQEHLGPTVTGHAVVRNSQLNDFSDD